MAPSTKPCICPVCEKTVRKTEYSIACTGCVNYFHPRCINISDSEVRTNKALKFVCSCCKKKKSGQDFDQIFNDMNESLKRQMEVQAEKCFAGFRSIIDGLIDAFRAEVMGKLQAVQDDVTTCKQQLKDVQRHNEMLQAEVDECKCKLRSAELQTSIFERRLNRADVLINGLPRSIRNLREPVINIAKACNIALHPADLQHCCYIYGGKSVLVKFNSVQMRDALMANYFRSNHIHLRDIMDTDVSSRIYLNDHLTPAASKLVHCCRKLLKRKIIDKFVLINGDLPKVRMTFGDGLERICDLEQCLKIDVGEACISDRNTNGGGVPLHEAV